MGETAAHADFRPRLALRFGITGHRPPRLSADHHETIRDHCKDVFRKAEETLAELHREHSKVFAPEAPNAKLVTSLAEGADVLAAQAALEAGLGISVCLPFPPETYAEDFGKEEWSDTQALIDRADSLMALTDHHGADTAAYEMAGKMVLGQCDILLAVWDGEASRGRGGTTEVIAEAVALNQPVIHIDATGKSPPELLWGGLHEAIPERPSIDGVERAPASEALPELIRALCEPPVRPEDLKSLEKFVAGDMNLRRYSFGWPILLALTGAKPLASLRLTSGSAEESADYMRSHVAPFSTCGAFGTRLNEKVLSRFGRADAQANQFSLRFRSSMVTNFTMAGLAVLFALSGLLAPELKKLFIIGELMVITAIILNTRGAQRLKLHQFWLDRRHLAERLRLLSLSSVLGRLSLRDVEDGTRHPGWVSWYARATARELGLVTAVLDKSFLKIVRNAIVSMIDEQVDYHIANAGVMHRANHRLHQAGDFLFYGTIIACIAYLTVSLGMGHMADNWGIAPLVTFVTALFPAIAGALYGIRTQGDFAGTSERSTVIAYRLEQLRAAIASDPLTYERLVERSHRLGEIMLAEVQQWRLHYETRPLSLPG
ncbi:hypothetical protein [Qipengyuania sp. RANM35]|uniref:hypothetical protein n=1 Tax=Qipengyuania sp. RANM35 TaxID=3068635 RepID=UPI0034DB2581